MVPDQIQDQQFIWIICWSYSQKPFIFIFIWKSEFCLNIWIKLRSGSGSSLFKNKFQGRFRSLCFEIERCMFGSGFTKITGILRFSVQLFYFFVKNDLHWLLLRLNSNVLTCVYPNAVFCYFLKLETSFFLGGGERI